MMVPVRYSSTQGLTLVETVVVIGLFTVLSLAVTYSIAAFYRDNAYTVNQATEIENARRGMAEWNRDAKELTTGADGSYPVEVIEQHRFGYYSNTDQDPAVEYVEYVLGTTTLRKDVYEPSGSPPGYSLSAPDRTEILSRHVQNRAQATTTFRYFDNAGTQLSSTSPRINVRYIRMQLSINVDPARSPGGFILRSSLAPRNLKDNL